MIGARMLAAAAITVASLDAPVLAAAQTSPSSTGMANPSGSADQLIRRSAQAVDDVRDQQHYATLLDKAKGVFVVPDMGEGALGIGADGGQDVLLKRTSGGWSQPAFPSIGTISVGPQAGGSAGETVMLLMTTEAVNDFTRANNFSVGGDAGLTVANYSVKGQAPVGKGDIVAWSKQSGAFAGANLSATDITSNTGEARSFYDRQISTRRSSAARRRMGTPHRRC